MKNLIIASILLSSTFQLNGQWNSKSAYQTFINKIIDITEQNICNPAFLDTEAWTNFIKTISKKKHRKLDKEAFSKVFNEEAAKLPFSHYYINSAKIILNSTTKKKEPFVFKRIDNNSCIIHIRKFAPDAPAMVKIIKELSSYDYQNLIIDLRGNSGGSLDAAVVLGRYLTNKPIDAGSYLTRNWFLKEKRYPSVAEISTFDYLSNFSYEGFMEAAAKDAFRMVIPSHNGEIFQGEIYVLTDRKTASACEPFAFVLKNLNNCTIVGEKTAGQMLSARWFFINDDFSLFVPITDYITAEGSRIDKVGVEPDIKVSGNFALREVMKQIEQ